jgi:hypothetical protein
MPKKKIPFAIAGSKPIIDTMIAKVVAQETINQAGG